ncbi:MAG: MBL fold metallo-hydrolase [Bacilli bacterium]|nr:MBL fold metallo-hydrolase [Bacilli bacterium]
MADTGIVVTHEDKTVAEEVSYDQLAPLGSAAHPLSTSQSEYIEILTFEQPSQYGDAYLIKAGDATIAIDFGHPSNYRFSDNSLYADLLKNKYSDYLTNSHLDLLIVTHPHSDHYGGYSALKSVASSIGMIVDYGYYASSAENYRRNLRDYYVNLGTAYHRIYDMVNHQNGGLERTYITSELFIDWLDTGYYSVNYEDGPTVNDANVTSLAGILAYRDFSFFFSGDLQDNPDGYGGTGGLGETSLVNLNQDKSDIFHNVTMMKAAHHASSKANNNNLLNILEPKIVTISAGAPDSDIEYNGKTGVCAGHPHLQALSRFLTQGFKRVVPKVYLNFVNGTTSFVTNGYDKIYVKGSPLKMSYQGTSANGSIAQTYGSTTDMFNDIRKTSWALVCHGL